MGCSLNAYFPIDQDEVDEFIKKNNIDIKDWKQTKLIADHFYEKVSGKKCGPGIGSRLYSYDRDEEKHIIYEYHSCKYVRDHKLLKNKDLPYELSLLVYYIYTPDDAIEKANKLREYFPEDEDLMYFADWLETTSKYCYAYRCDS